MTSSWCSHGTYQHEAITSRSRQLLMMGTWLPETCWATVRREIKNTKSDIQLVFLTHTKSPISLHTARFWCNSKPSWCTEGHFVDLALILQLVDSSRPRPPPSPYTFSTVRRTARHTDSLVTWTTWHSQAQRNTNSSTTAAPKTTWFHSSNSFDTSFENCCRFN